MTILRVNVALFVVILAACASAPRADYVYQELGQREGIDQLVEELLNVVYADERIAFLFQDADRATLHDLIVDQICMETGGPCEYEGLSMAEGHSGFEIKESEFDAFVEDFILAMEAQGIDFRTQNRVLAIFAPMRSDIVYQ